MGLAVNQAVFPEDFLVLLPLRRFSRLQSAAACQEVNQPSLEPAPLGKGGAPMGVGRGQRRTAAFSQAKPLGCEPTQFAAGRLGGGAGGRPLLPSPQKPVSMRQDRPSICSHWKITLHFQKGKQSVNLSLRYTFVPLQQEKWRKL